MELEIDLERITKRPLECSNGRTQIHLSKSDFVWSEKYVFMLVVSACKTCLILDSIQPSRVDNTVRRLRGKFYVNLVPVHNYLSCILTGQTRFRVKD